MTLGLGRPQPLRPSLYQRPPGPAPTCCAQVVQPAVHLPPPLGRLFKSIACQQLRGIFEDVQAEARRIREGQPTLWRAQQE